MVGKAFPLFPNLEITVFSQKQHKEFIITNYLSEVQTSPEFSFFLMDRQWHGISPEQIG